MTTPTREQAQAIIARMDALQNPRRYGYAHPGPELEAINEQLGKWCGANKPSDVREDMRAVADACGPDFICGLSDGSLLAWGGERVIGREIVIIPAKPVTLDLANANDEAKPQQAMVSIFTEGAPTLVCTLSSFFAENSDGLMSEDLQELFQAFADGRPWHCGGGAAAEFVVKLYEPYDEDSSWAQITCPDYEHHGTGPGQIRGFGCQTCRQVPL